MVFLLKMNIDLDVFLDFNFVLFNFKSVKNLRRLEFFIIILSDECYSGFLIIF